MDDDCVIARPGRPTGKVNPANGRPILEGAGEVYAGRCLVSSGAPADTASERGGVVAPIDETWVSIPLSAPNVPSAGDLVVVTGSRRDQPLVGRTLKITRIPYRTFAVSRKMRVEVQPANALDVLGLPPLVPAGPPPGGGTDTNSDSVFTEVAVTALSGHRVVVLSSAGARYADPTDRSQVSAAMALTLGAAAAGAQVTLSAEGEVEEPGWSWVPGSPLFVGPAGTLTQTAPTAPTSAWLRVIGTAISPTEIRLAFGPPISLA